MKRIAVVGIGIGGSYGARVHKSSKSEFVAICARSKEKLLSKKELYQKEIGANPAIYTDLNTMLRNENLDGLIIATPSSTHHEIAIKAIQHGVHVLIDKPIDISQHNIDKIALALQQHPVKLGVIYPMRFKPEYVALKKIISESILGRSLICDMRLKWYRDQSYYDRGGWKGTWEYDGGGSLMNQGAHPIDLLCWFFGKPVKVVGDFGCINHRVETEDWAAAIVEFENGLKCSITTTTCVNSHEGDQICIDYHAENGTIKLVNGKHLDGDQVMPIEKTMYDHPVEDFIDALVYNRDPAVGLADGALSVGLINSIYESARLGQCIYL